MRMTRVLWAGAFALTACTAPTVGPRRDRDASATPDAAAVADANAMEDAFVADAFVPIDASPDAAAPECDGAMIALPDPSAPDGTEVTQPADCSGCPRFTSVEITPGATTAAIVGAIVGAASCTWTLVSPSCGGATGAFGPDPEFGMFHTTLPLFCGTNRLQLVCENASGRTIATREIAGPACASRDVQITLAWGSTSTDQELHLVRSGARINDAVGDCTWFNCVSGTLDWGVVGDASDDPHKDVDWTSTFGPENIFLSRASDGRYEVMVEYWGSGTTDSPSVTITLEGRTIWTGSHAMEAHDVWDVGTIVYPGPTFVPVDTVVPCAASWRTTGSHGCELAIP